MLRGSAGSSEACTVGQTRLPPVQWGTAAWRRPGGGEEKANEKAGWHCNQQETETAGNRGTGHLPWLLVSYYSMTDVEASSLQSGLQSHLQSRVMAQGILKILCGLYSPFKACVVPLWQCCVSISPHEKGWAQQNARFSKTCLFFYSAIWNFITNLSDKEIKSKYLFQRLHNDIYSTLQKIPAYPLLLSDCTSEGFQKSRYFMSSAPFPWCNNERKDKEKPEMFGYYQCTCRITKTNAVMDNVPTLINYRMTESFRWENISKIIEVNR